jgi:CRP/FNR family cyclic AMP-dependent transcriptional regulator
MLEKIQFFQGLDKSALHALEARAETRNYKKGVIIFGRGDESDYLCVLLDGLVHAYIDGAHGKKIIVNTIGPGELFGELAMFSDEPRSANIVAVEACEVLIVQRKAVMQAMAEFPAFSKNIIQRLARKVNSLTDDVSSLALLDVYSRIARILQQHTDAGITGRLTQQDIADRVGSSREMVSRILKDLRLGGYISIENRQISILKPLPNAW